MSQPNPTPPGPNLPADSSWKNLHTVGGITALLWIAIAPAEIIIGLLPGVDETLARTVTVTDWFTLFQSHWFLGLRSLGLLNIAGAILFIPTILAIFSLLRRESEAYAALGTIVFFLGVAVYLANSRAFPMLSLSHQYARAATDAERSLLATAGQAMLAEGESRAGILIIEFSFLIVSAVMLRTRSFSKVTACAGIVGSALMMILEVAFMPPKGVGMVVAAAGGLLMMLWSLLIGRRLLELARKE